jgi:KUP system potassium uptake protein
MEKVTVEQLGSGFYWIHARYGFMEEPVVAGLLTLAQAQGLPSKMTDPSFFLGRQQLEVGEETEMARWRSVLFVVMARNAMDPATFFGLPIDRVIEVGVRLRI